MPETVNTKTGKPEATVLLLAMMETKRSRKGRRIDEWGPVGEPLTVQVELKVNGVEVPFVETLHMLWDNENARIEERAKSLALQMLSETGLMPAVNALRAANFKLARVMHKVAASIPDDA